MRHDHVPSDADLARAAQAGDSISLGILLERYRPSLHAAALGILGYGPEVEDAVHDTFLVALSKIGHLREPGAVGGWLHTSLRNICISRIRERHAETLDGEMPPYVEHRFLEGLASVVTWNERWRDP